MAREITNFWQGTMSRAKARPVVNLTFTVFFEPKIGPLLLHHLLSRQTISVDIVDIHSFVCGT